MNRSTDWLNAAAREGIITDEQAAALRAFANDHQTDGESDPSGPAERDSQSEGAHLLYYIGGLIAIGAMTVFMTLGWEQFGGGALSGIAFIYAVGGLWATERLYQSRLHTPAGLLAAFVVVLTPIAVYGIQLELGMWPEDEMYRTWLTGFDGRGLMLQSATLIVGGVLLARYRLPFLTMPLVVVAWYIMMNLTPYFASGDVPSDTLYRSVAIGAGALLLVLALWIDRQRYERDFAFWLYTVGALSMWGSLTITAIATDWALLWYAAASVVFMVAGVSVQRRVFTILGALGLAGYLFYLARDIFRDSIWFPFALTFIGLSIVAFGVWWQRNEQAIYQHIQKWLPM